MRGQQILETGWKIEGQGMPPQQCDERLRQREITSLCYKQQTTLKIVKQGNMTVLCTNFFRQLLFLNKHHLPIHVRDTSEESHRSKLKDAVRLCVQSVNSNRLDEIDAVIDLVIYKMYSHLNGILL